MCATNVWAVNAAAYTPAFELFTAERIGVAPQPTEFRIASDRMRPSAVTFTLTHNMCDCSTVIGLRDGGPHDGETSAAAWLGWLTELPHNVPRMSRIAVLRAWNPDGDAIRPTHAKGVRIDQVDEALLRSIQDDSLLTIDYPEIVWTAPRAY